MSTLREKLEALTSETCNGCDEYRDCDVHTAKAQAMAMAVRDGQPGAERGECPPRRQDWGFRVSGDRWVDPERMRELDHLDDVEPDPAAPRWRDGQEMSDETRLGAYEEADYLYGDTSWRGVTESAQPSKTLRQMLEDLSTETCGGWDNGCHDHSLQAQVMELIILDDPIVDRTYEERCQLDALLLAWWTATKAQPDIR